MRILIKPRKWVETRLDQDSLFCRKFNFISIYSSKHFSPLPDRRNILKLEFDDMTDMDIPQKHADGSPLILFNSEHAGRILRFVQEIDRRKILVVHCDAGISRSGAIGKLLNEYCNRMIEENPDDLAKFAEDNPAIIPNPFVYGILRTAIGNSRK